MQDFDYLKQLEVNQVDGLTPLSLNDFVKMKWVGDDLKKTWRRNYLENMVRKNIVPVERTGDARDKCCVLVGSSPAIRGQIRELKGLSKHFLLIASNGAYGWLLHNGIVPDYVILIEGRDHVVKDVLPQSTATLITSPFVDPRIHEAWQGMSETYMCGGGDGFDDLLHDDWDGKADIDIGGGNVINCAFLWSYKYLGCRNYITIGTSLCYYNNYYVDGRSTEHVMKNLNDQDHIKAVDMYGQVVNTTAPLLLYKTWLETYSRVAKVDFVNATEDGILGTYPEPVSYKDDNISYRVKHLPWMSIAPLSMSIDAYNEKLGG